MQCLWPSTKGRIRHAVAAILLVASVSCMLLFSEAIPLPHGDPNQTPLSKLENVLRRVPAHSSEFSLVARPSALPRCGNVRPPEALLTPDPLLHIQNDLRVQVSFIVGADGRVHSALVLDSGGPSEDQMVLRAVRSWRYRPALCNGVPTDSEALVRFTVR